MKRRSSIRIELFVLAVGLLGLVIAGRLAFVRVTETVTDTRPELDPPTAYSPADQAALASANPGFLYGRVTTDDGETYEGRLRWGGAEEAFWGDYFSGVKGSNPWADRVPPEELATGHQPFTIFGLEFGGPDTIDLTRPFFARFGDIAQIHAPSPIVVRVTLKSGTVYDTNYLEMSDFADGVRVWNGVEVIDLGPQRVRTVDFLPTTRLSAAPSRLYGTVRTRGGTFTGHLQWNREQSVGADTLEGTVADGQVSLRFDTIRGLARESMDAVRVTLRDGREIVASGQAAAGQGIYVEDERFGRVLVSWNAFESVELGASDSGPAYGDFPAGRPLTGSVTLRTGQRLVGRLVYDLDESETTDSLDAPLDGVNYLLPFNKIASIALQESAPSGTGRARITLHGGEVLPLELSGDLSPRNGGLLVFAGDNEPPTYVRWAEVAEIAFDPALHAKVQPAWPNPPHQA